MSHQQRLVVVSNRLPIIVSGNEDQGWTLKPGSGGLVTALAPVLRNRGGMWIGWTGTHDDSAELRRVIADSTRDAGYELHPVMLTRREVEDFYHGYSNEQIWPLFHDLQSMCNFEPSHRAAYIDVNRKYATTIIQNCTEEDFVWIHDYQLMLVGQAMREQGFRARLGFFLHIPFPPLDILVKLPDRHRLLAALLEFDLIGFQTHRDRRNFIQCIRALVSNARVGAGKYLQPIRVAEREVKVGVFPIGIDFEGFRRDAASEEVAQEAWLIHENLPNRQIVLGIDRLDYTKGLLYRLRAFANLLERFPELHRQVTLVQIVVPSRVDIPKYQALKVEIERMVSEINGRFTHQGWIPVHYMFKSIDYRHLLGFYRTAEIALVTPLKDGMNLVSKEFCACSLEGNSVLILSEFAGAAAQLQRGALLVNPYDIEQVADALHQALTMPHDERAVRMRRLQRNIRAQDVFWWVDSFIHAAIHKDLEDFPVIADYLPSEPALPVATSIARD